MFRLRYYWMQRSVVWQMDTNTQEGPVKTLFKEEHVKLH